MISDKDEEYLLRVSIDANIQVRVKAKSKGEAMEKVSNQIDNGGPLDITNLTMEYSFY